MRSVCLRILGVAVLSSVGEGALLETSTFGAAEPRSFQTGGASYYSSMHYMSKPTTALTAEEGSLHHDSALPYFQVEPTVSVREGHSAAPPEGDLKWKQPVEEKYRSLHKMEPVPVLTHITGVKSLLLSIAAFLVCIVAMWVRHDISRTGRREEGFIQDNFGLPDDGIMLMFGVGTSLLVSGLLDLALSLRKIRRGNLHEDGRLHIRGLPVYLVTFMLLNSWREFLNKYPMLYSFALGVGTAGLGHFVAGVLQFIDYKIKRTNPLASASGPVALTGEASSSDLSSTPQLQNC